MKKTKKLPIFANEDEEAAFWLEHDFTDYYDTTKAKKVMFPNLKPSTQSITIRMPKMMLERLKILANEMDVPYQSLAKIFLDEKIKEKQIQRT
ncbi:MAG: BrnA antitoxin family protein [Pseudomonadota bacterium]